MMPFGKSICALLLFLLLSHLQACGSGLEGFDADTGALPGSPSSVFGTMTSGLGQVVSSENYTVFVNTASQASSTTMSNGVYRISDPIMELGINTVLQQTGRK